MAAPAAVLSVLVTASTGGASAQLTRLDRQLKGTAATANTSGQRIATGLKYASVGALAVGAASAKLAYDFENSMSKVRSLVGASQKQTDQWSKQLLNLSPKIGKSPKELADALYYVSSSGIKASKVMGTVKVAAQASALGLGQSEQVADALTSAMNAYAKSGLTARDATNVLIKTVKVGKLEADELAGSIGRVIPVSSQLGVSFNDVGAALGAMSLQGLDAAEATTALRGIFTSFIKPTAESEAALQSVGLSAAQLRDELDKKGTLATLSTLSEAFQGNVEEMGKVFPNVRALVGAFNLTGENAKTNADIFRQLGADTDDLGKSWGEFSQTPAQKLRSAMAGIQTELTKIGIQILPVVADEFKKFADILGDKSLTTDQKIAKIGEQLTQAAEKWGPKLAEAGGKLGLALIKGIADAFWHSDILGKLFIAGTFVRLIGGPGAIAKLGGTLGAGFGTAFAGSAVPLIGGLIAGGLAGYEFGQTGIVQRAATKLTSGLDYLRDRLDEFSNDDLQTFVEATAHSGHAVTMEMIETWKKSGDITEDGAQRITAAVRTIKFKDTFDKLRDQYGSLRLAASNMTKGAKNSFIEYARAARDMGQITDAQFGRIWDTFQNTKQKNRDMWRDVARVTGEKTGDIKRNVGDFARVVASDYDGMVEATGSGITLLMQNTGSALKALGLKQELKWSLKRHSTGQTGGGYGNQSRQRGGMIYAQKGLAVVPGHGTGDIVPDVMPVGSGVINKKAARVMLEPGEIKVAPDVVKKIGGKSAIDAINTRWPRFGGALQKGGTVGQPDLGGHPSDINPNLAKLIATMQSHFPGLAVTATTDGNHVAGSDHYSGDAVDLASGDYGYMDKASAWINSSGLFRSLKQGIHNPNLSVNAGQHVDPSFFASVWAGHRNHIHLAIVGALSGKYGAAAQQIAKVMLEGPGGPLQDIGQAALDKVRATANKFITSKTPMESEAGVDYVPGGDGSVAAQLMRVFMGAGLSKIGAAAITGNAYQESTWNPNSVEGLFGFHSSPVSMGDLAAYAAKQHRSPNSPVTQGNFLLQHLSPDHSGFSRGFANTLSAGPLESSVALFMNEWERPNPAYANLSRRIEGARMALSMAGKQRGGIVAKLQKGGFLDPFIDRIYNAKATKKQSVQEIRKLTAKAAKHKIAKLATQGLSFDKNSEIAGKLAKLREQADTFGEYASNASNGTFRGKTEAEWTTMELDALWAFRQTLAKVEEKVKERREQAEKIAKRAQKLLKQWDDRLDNAKARLAREGETPKGWKGDDPSKVSVEKWNKLGGGKRLATMRKFLAAGGKLPGDRKFLEDGSIATPDSQPDLFPNTKGMSAVSSLLKGTVIPGLLGNVIPALSGDIKELASRFDTVQGKGLTHRFLKHGLPAYGSADALGGEIFTAQQRLAELGKSTTSDANPLDITGIRDIVEAARYGTFDYQLDPTFAGMFAKGGAIPSGKWGIAGEAGPEIIHGPATVTPAAGGVSIENNVYLDGLDLIIDTRIDGKLAKHERKAWLAEKAGR